MWMPSESQSPVVTGGATEVAGVVIRPPQSPPQQPNMLFAQQPAIIFRIQADSGHQYHCRFEGAITGMIDQGDRVILRGGLKAGVFHATQILDPGGVVLAKSGCFVATAVCGDEDAWEVATLRRFRDCVLARSTLGWWCIRQYWRRGPRWAARLNGHHRICRGIRIVLLAPMCLLIERLFRNMRHTRAGLGDEGS